MNYSSAESPAYTEQDKYNEQDIKTDSRLADTVRAALGKYFEDLDGHAGNDLYRMVIDEVEKPLLDMVMQQMGGNQTHAAQILGITRSTLRKKLKRHQLD